MIKVFILIYTIMFTSLAHAHVDTTADGFLTGLLHPVLGFDHLLAMVSVGILSAQMGGKSIWQVPFTFIIVMSFGGITGILGIPIFSVELGIAISVFFLGIALATERKLPHLIAMLFVGFFAIFHGHAHGMEMPDIVEPYLYILGFISGTAAIHLFGVLIGILAKKNPKSEQFLRHIGSGIAGIGFYLIFLHT